jgi:TolB-like protein/class 3 adenylate cyclase
MVEGSIERRLAAIVVADVVGYSKLINADEAGTHARFRELQNDLFEPTVQSHGGRVIKTMGDAFLLEFPSAVEAVACATKIQNILPELEAHRPDDQRIIFRIGINVGDIIVDGDDIHGDGVIVASRLEAIADAGGILISDDTYRQVRDRLDISVDDQGEVDVKNIDRPVRVFRVLGDGEEKKAPAHVTTPRWKNSAAAAVVALVAIIGGSTWWWLQRLDFVPADPSKFAYKLPDKPSIAVMPFANLSGDSGQDFLADGIVDSIITALARTEQLFVIGRNSTFSFKGKPFIVKEVAEKFGVRHVLEGSFQKTKETIRITARLIDALSGRQIWGGTFDRKTSDILALQDDITAKVVEELQVKLTVGEQGRVWRRETKNPEAYQLMLKARDFWYRFTPEDILKARAFAEQALALDPSFGSAEGWRARTFYLEFYNGWARDPALAYSKSIKSLEKALAMGNSPAWLHMHSAYILLQSGEREKAFAAT